MPDSPSLADVLTMTYTEQVRRLAALDRLPQCDSYWPSDPPGPDYPGTRCGFLQHPRDTGHAARIPGSSTVVHW